MMLLTPVANEKTFNQKSFKYFVWTPLTLAAILPLVSTTPTVPVTNLLLVSLILVANLPPVLLTQVTGDVDTGGEP
jgi:hypothetical protein